MIELTKTYQPRPGGWGRLAARLEVAESERLFELRMWAVAASVMMVITAVLLLHERDGQVLQIPAPSPAVVIDGADAVKVAESSNGIRYYWVMAEK